MKELKSRCKTFLLLFALLYMGNTVSLRAQNAEAAWAIQNYKHYYAEARTVQSPEKEAFIANFRKEIFNISGINYHLRSVRSKNYTLDNLIKQLDAEGCFSDLSDSKHGPQKGNTANSGGDILEAYERLSFLADAFHSKIIDIEDKELWGKVQKAIIHYGKLEIARPNDWRRFHASCFAFPKAAATIYFCTLPQMDMAEQGNSENSLLVEACDMLKTIGLQAWTQPLRNDETDNNVVQVERFRNHVWWEGGNGLGGIIGYRPLFEVAMMLRSIPMIDLLADICERGISSTSQNTGDTSFWHEGLTADGGGWGHGKQCLIWGYPIDGTVGSLSVLGQLKDSPWKTCISRKNIETLMNYFHGGNFYYYKGYTTPCLDRNSMKYVKTPQPIPYQKILNPILSTWKDQLTQAEFQELKQLQKEVENKNILMEKYDVYNGTRYFFNNEDLIKKNKDYYMMVNMSSVRCDGLESACGFADGYNFYSTDGSTFFQKTGYEYRSIYGGFDVTATPGVTAREGMDRLKPVTNWRGYSSKHNFAAASTTGGENAVAGYVFEKMNASERENVNDRGNSLGENSILYGVKAHKSYFMLGDYMVALGAGITNSDPSQPGNIRTTIDQTAHTDSVYPYSDKGIKWVVQKNKFAYSVLPEYQDKMHYLCERRKTDWIKRNASNRSQKELPQTADIFHIWIDHGHAPVNDSYGYVVYAGKGEPKSGYPFKVLRNDMLVQAIESIDKKVIEAVFYHPNETLKASKDKVSVSTPCTVLIEKQDKKVQLTVTDALMDKECKEIMVTLNGQNIICKMPQGERSGAPVTVYL